MYPKKVRLYECGSEATGRQGRTASFELSIGRAPPAAFAWYVASGSTRAFRTIFGATGRAVTRKAKQRWRRWKRRATTSSVTEQQQQCPSGRYWRGAGLCGCSSASNCGWVRGVWVGLEGTERVLVDQVQ
jgi:hypothetical protein